MSKLADFNYELIHKPGATNRADALSRNPAMKDGEHDNEEVTVLPDKLFVQALQIHSLETCVWDAQKEATDTL
jgi:hypothetical protein